ncbi:GntR family transcriptional regulator [Pseudorhodoferax sp. Leaf267]|uniref:GntR family transcriptional regulator n=1 Tax=Pseudorhodoferax sp. Leaf267 TaxID=1736316 RepID=UPI000701FD27|nr:GntR family transcriptional regulator [Pseudorhodoferax sp. Leaf267]KQP12222.1 GntR family transcriptional regulator [Pseudorhodoferax sp. Leaf267]
MTTPTDTAAPKANFTNIARHLQEAIATGHFTVGALLPTELELCKHYGTSRHTVRAALAELQALGLVSRRKNVGTRVVSARPRAGFRPSLASVDDLVQFGAEHLRVVQTIAQAKVEGALARELGCADGAVWLRISSLRLVADGAGVPIGWTDVYIDPAYADIGEMARANPDALISSLIEERYQRQIAEIAQDVRASTIDDAAMAQALKLPAGASALRIVRQYFDAQGEMFEASVSVHPADRFSVSMRLRRSPA